MSTAEEKLQKLSEELQVMNECYMLLHKLPKDSAYRALRWITAKLHEDLYK